MATDTTEELETSSAKRYKSFENFCDVLKEFEYLEMVLLEENDYDG